jgi:uncharacterized protein
MRFNSMILLLSCVLCAKEAFKEPWGKDTTLLCPLHSQAEKTANLAVRIADAIIRFHQEVISPVDGPRSHFRPTSSRYMQLAMQRYGFWKGFIMGCDRLLRENDEEWVYHTVQLDGRLFKYDPAWEDKYHGLRGH